MILFIIYAKGCVFIPLDYKHILFIVSFKLPLPLSDTDLKARVENFLASFYFLTKQKWIF